MTEGEKRSAPAQAGKRQRATVLGLATLTGLATTHAVRESDPFWHLTQGRAVLAAGSRTLADPVALEEFSQPLVVPEWLWDVLTYTLHATFGWPALTVLTALLSASVVLGVWHLGRTLAPHLGVDTWLLAAGPATVLALARLRLRPQTAFLALLPWVLSFSYRFRDATDARQRLRYGSLLAGGTMLWAQVHGSFVIAPVLVGVPTLPMWRDPERRRALLLLALAMALAALSSAHGTDLLGYVLAHGTGDASLFISDTTAPSWANFNPAENLYGPLYAAGVVACVVLALRRGFLPMPELALALFGAAMGFAMVRLFVTAGMLLLPLAFRLLDDVRGFRRRRYAAALGLTAVLLGLHVDRVTDKRGPLLRSGPLSGQHPALAAAYLRDLKAPQRVLSDYDAGGSLGFWLAGRARTFVDARTPAFFDETDYAVARDSTRSQAGLVRLARLHRATAVVTRRGSRWCESALAGGMVGAVAGPAYTTLTLPAGAPSSPLALQPCGPERLPEDACDPMKRAALERDIERHAELGSPPLAAFLAAALKARCEGAAHVSPDSLPPLGASRGFTVERNLLMAELRIAHGQQSAAVELLASMVVPPDPRVVDFVRARHLTLEPSLAQALLEPMFEAYRDSSPDWVLVSLAHLALQRRDPYAARFFAFRAAVRGAQAAAPVLHWLGEHGADETARQQAKAWMRVLAREAPTRPPPPMPTN